MLTLRFYKMHKDNTYKDSNKQPILYSKYRLQVRIVLTKLNELEKR